MRDGRRIDLQQQTTTRSLVVLKKRGLLPASLFLQIAIRLLVTKAIEDLQQKIQLYYYYIPKCIGSSKKSWRFFVVVAVCLP